MYICDECRSVFAQPDDYYVQGDEEGHVFRVTSCPYCMSESIRRTWQCDNCGEYLEGEYCETIHGDVLCSKCYIIKEL